MAERGLVWRDDVIVRRGQNGIEIFFFLPFCYPCTLGLPLLDVTIITQIRLKPNIPTAASRPLCLGHDEIQT